MLTFVNLLRTVVSPLRSADTYRRWVYFVLGGALFVPVFVAMAVLLSLLVYGGLPGEAGVGLPGLVALPVAVVVGGAIGLIPAVATQQGQLARALLGGPLTVEPLVVSTVWRERWRTAVWTALHLLVGIGISLVTMVVLTEAALLASSVFTAEPATMSDDLWRWVQDPALPAAVRLFALLIATILVLGFIYSVALVGATAARVAPALLGPSVTDRLDAVQAHADELSRRNRLAADLHDSLGHALSVVGLQAGAAARVIDHDPAFARQALDAIAEQSRTATAELDHVLGLLRDQAPAVTPQRDLTDLADLVEAARSTGTDLRLNATGRFARVPPAVSREAYRLGQEGLTNALRHGDRDAPITIDLHVEDARLRLTVANRRSARTRRAGGGRGLTAMAERARLVGGHLDWQTQDGFWRLEATIPWSSRS